jgi:hypothetical protein
MKMDAVHYSETSVTIYMSVQHDIPDDSDLRQHRRLHPTSITNCSKSKGLPRQAEVALGVPDRLRPPIFSTFGTTRQVGLQPNAPAAFTPGEIPGTHFQRLSLPQGTWFCRKEPRKKIPVTPPGIDPGTVRLVARRLNHYATLGPVQKVNTF